MTKKTQNDVWAEALAIDDEGKAILNNDGRVIMKKIKAFAVISMRVGDYTHVKMIINNMEEYVKFTGRKIKEIISLITVSNV